MQSAFVLQPAALRSPETNLCLLVKFGLVPALLLAALVLFPFHGFDVAVMHLFYENGWPWHDSRLFMTLTHTVPKVITILIALAVPVTYAVRAQRGTLTDDTARRLRYLFVSMLIAVLSVWWLKQTTGVSCPWDVTAFGGQDAITSPVWSWSPRAGNCWPAGHAGSGFCLFGFYFAFRGINDRAAKAGFWFAMAFGLFCGITRMMQGAHFPSHVIATMLIDWLICAALASVMLRPRKTGGTASAAAAK